MKTPTGSKTKTRVWVVENGRGRARTDELSTEEPLEIRLVAGGARRTVAITMRSPGNDFDLAAGFLYSEGIINSRQDICRMTHCVDPGIDVETRYNIVNVELAAKQLPILTTLERHFYTSSACGVCGKTSLEALQRSGYSVISSQLKLPAEIFYSLPKKLRAAQRVFSSTGGLHAAAAFDAEGNLLSVREDVGRHNALDKLIGKSLLANDLPLDRCIVMVSGRSSFEILQKCLVAGVSIVCAVSAPSSLAVQLAVEFGITLIGFLREERFNVYSGVERVVFKNEN